MSDSEAAAVALELLTSEDVEPALEVLSSEAGLVFFFFRKLYRMVCGSSPCSEAPA